MSYKIFKVPKCEIQLLEVAYSDLYLCRTSQMKAVRYFHKNLNPRYLTRICHSLLNHAQAQGPYICDVHMEVRCGVGFLKFVTCLRILLFLNSRSIVYICRWRGGKIGKFLWMPQMNDPLHYIVGALSCFGTLLCLIIGGVSFKSHFKCIELILVILPGY